jgi:hypothetical protein
MRRLRLSDDDDDGPAEWAAPVDVFSERDELYTCPV